MVNLSPPRRGRVPCTRRGRATPRCRGWWRSSMQGASLAGIVRELVAFSEVRKPAAHSRASLRTCPGQPNYTGTDQQLRCLFQTAQAM
jgi:hypothetical protein